MTVALTLKVHDGVVLAADSASTLANATGVVNIYNNANKISNLRKGLPIGTITWGLGSIGTASMSTLLKDLRRRFSGDDRDHRDWELAPDSYEVSDVARRVREFLVKEYATAYPDSATRPAGALGVVVAGYSAGKGLAEEYAIEMESGKAKQPRLLQPADSFGLAWFGQPEAIHRLTWGYSGNMEAVLNTKLGVPKTQLPAAMQTLAAELAVPLVAPAMPLQDAIDLAHFLVELTIHWARFTPQAPIVGGPIEIAAISKHEGFKWVRRKHYYSSEFNPKEP